MAFSIGTPAIGGLVGGAAPTQLQEESWADGMGPTYAGGGGRGGLADYYRKQGMSSPYKATRDPYFDQWGNQGAQNYGADRKQLSDLYGQLQAQAQGAPTAAQNMQRDQFALANQNQQQVAQSVGGGAYARSAAHSAIQGNAAINGANQVQQANQLQAADMMSAQAQMQQVAQMRRAQDLQAQGMTAEDAARQAEAEVKARGLNIQRQTGYGALEAGSIGNDYSMYGDAVRRAAAGYGQRVKNSQQDTANFLNLTGGMIGSVGKLAGA